MQMQKFRTKAPDHAIEQPRKPRADRCVKPLPVTGGESDFDLADVQVAAMVYTRLGVSEHGDGNRARCKGRAKIGAAAFDSTRMRREKFTNVENAHLCRVRRAQWRP